MAEPALLDHVADIVAAHVSNNAVGSSEIPALIQSVYASLALLGQPAFLVEEVRRPAVPVRNSVKPAAIACLECGIKIKLLKRHLGTEHGLTPTEYRTRWNLPSDYPMVAPDYTATRRQLAIRFGLGRKRPLEAKVPPVGGGKPAKSIVPKTRKPRRPKAPVADTAEIGQNNES